jgi:hypothetical protein
VLSFRTQTTRINKKQTMNISELVDSVSDDEKPKFVMSLNDSAKTNWDLIVMMLAVWNVYTIPVVVCFEPTVSVSVLFLEHGDNYIHYYKCSN